MDTDEKRSRTDGMEGVGGRQEETPGQVGGGGYQNFCKISADSGMSPAAAAGEDPRIQELQLIGLSHTLIKVAQAIGYERFMAMWQILDRAVDYGVTQRRLRVPCYNSYLSFQRNRYIRSLFDTGMTPVEIQKTIELELCEKLSRRHIRRIIESH